MPSPARSEGHWIPILDGEIHDRAVLAAADIRTALEQIDTAYAPTSLARGAPGLALLLAHLDVASGTRTSEHAATRYLAQSIEWTWNPPNGAVVLPGLFDGFTGIAWALKLCAQIYGTAVDLTDIDQDILAMLSISSWQGPFDLISGLVGYGVYALEPPLTPFTRDIISATVTALRSMATPTHSGVSWFTPAHLLPPLKRATSPNGRFDLGVAHGVMGVMGFLARCIQADIATETATHLLRDGLRWLESVRVGAPATEYPLFINDRGRNIVVDHGYWGWCYGDLGLASVLYDVGRTLHERHLTKHAITVAEKSATRLLSGLPISHGVSEPGLCHGAAGIAHLFNRMFQLSGSEICRDAACVWFEHTLNHRQPEGGVAGFSATSLVRNGSTFHKMPVTGFLEGAAGIAAALSCATGPVQPVWQGFLLLAS